MAEIVLDRISKVVEQNLACGLQQRKTPKAEITRVRSGQPIELAVNTANLQFFDPTTGLSIGHPAASNAAAEASGSAAEE